MEHSKHPDAVDVRDAAVVVVDREAAPTHCQRRSTGPGTPTDFDVALALDNDPEPWSITKFKPPLAALPLILQSDLGRRAIRLLQDYEHNERLGRTLWHRRLGLEGRASTSSADGNSASDSVHGGSQPQ